MDGDTLHSKRRRFGNGDNVAVTPVVRLPMISDRDVVAVHDDLESFMDLDARKRGRGESFDDGTGALVMCIERGMRNLYACWPIMETISGECGATTIVASIALETT